MTMISNILSTRATRICQCNDGGEKCHFFQLYHDRYDPFIDYIKGICIILVILNHSISKQTQDKLMFCIWGEIAVPMFLLIQVFHSYKNGAKNCRFSFRKIWNRMIKYYLFAQVSIITVYAIAISIGGSWSYALPFYEGDGLISFFRKVTHGLGIGAGSYYIYIYILNLQ